MNDPLFQVVRMFTILHLVAARRPGKTITRCQLAEACHCSIKTIQRDMDNLISGSVPISWDRSERSYMLPDKGWTLPTLLLTQQDALALVRRLVADSPMFPFAEQVATDRHFLDARLCAPEGRLLFAFGDRLAQAQRHTRIGA